MYAEFSGDYWEIGYQAGKFWGDFLANCSNGEDFLNEYTEVLSPSEYEHNRFEYLKRIPEYSGVFEEIYGMCCGINESQFNTDKPFTNYDIFCHCLGESLSKGCTSFVVKTNSGYILEHSEEGDGVYPILFAKYCLKRRDGTEVEYWGGSYPFQLPGSSCGGNHFFSFQGNSIDHTKCKTDVCSHGKLLCPKTFMTRLWLEQKSAQDAIELIDKAGCFLPTHSFLVSKEEALSIEYYPGLDLNVILVDAYMAHTNHFIHKRLLIYNDKCIRRGHLRDSKERLNILNRTNTQFYDYYKLNQNINVVKSDWADSVCAFIHAEYDDASVQIFAESLYDGGTYHFTI